MLNLIYTFTIVTITVLCVAGVLAAKSKSVGPSKYLLIMLIICAIGNRIDMLPPQLPPDRFYELVGQFFGAFGSGMTWLFAMSILRDDFKFDVKSALVFGLSCTIPLMYFLTHVDLLPPISLFYWHFHMPIMVGIVVHVIWTGIQGFKDDLIGLRRQARIGVCALPTFLILVSVIAEYTVSEEMQIVVFLFAECLGISVLVFLLANFNQDFLSFSAPEPVPSLSDSEQGNAERDSVDSNIQDKDMASYRRLMNLMEQDRIFLDAELTVNTLAERVGIPAHQLRVIINQGMGFKNFSTFLAGYRINQVKTVLSDPEQARVPILTIALNNGFSSLATFNRLFKLDTGMSAGEYRKQALIKN